MTLCFDYGQNKEGIQRINILIFFDGGLDELQIFPLQRGDGVPVRGAGEVFSLAQETGGLK